MKTSTKIGMTFVTAIVWFLGTGGILLADTDPPPPRPPVHFPFVPLAPSCDLCDQSDRAACGWRPSLCALQSSATVAIYCCVSTAVNPAELPPVDFTPEDVEAQQVAAMAAVASAL